jgi:hypothetical protein
MISQLLSGSSNRSPNGPKEFIWDQLVTYTTYIFIVFTLLAAGEHLFTHSEARCLGPSAFNRDQAAYINGYCTRHVAKMERLAWLFLLEVVFVGGSHVVWSKLVSSALEQFFSMAPTIERYRDRETGRFDADSIEIVQRLQTHFGSRQRMTNSYRVKLVVQLIAAIGFLIASATYYKTDDFSENFNCSLSENLVNPWLTEWLSKLQCSHISLANVSLLNNKMVCIRDRVYFPCTYSRALSLKPLWVGIFFCAGCCCLCYCVWPALAL